LSFVPGKAIESRVILLSGEEEALRRRYLAELIALATQDGDFDLQTFEADASTSMDWIASAGTSPFLSARRTIVVRHILRKELGGVKGAQEDSDADGTSQPRNSDRDDLDGISKQLKTLPASALLVLVADEEAGDENRQRKFASTRKSWEKLVRDSGGVVATFSADAKQIRDAIKSETDRLGKKISDATALSLAEMTGSNLSRAIEELEKLSVYVGSELQIREADIRAVVVPSRDWNVYKLIDAIVDGAVSEALRQIRILVGSQTKAEDAAFSRILPTMSRQLRLMWQARACVEANCIPESAPEHVRRMFPEKPNLAKEPPYRQNRLLQQARRVDLEALHECFQAVSDADAKLKGLVDSYSAIETLEHMALRMVDVVGSRQTVRY
jgi:DNA polymerase III subunit delta